MNFLVYYAKDNSKQVDIENFTSSHVFVKKVEADNIDEVFEKMQGEVWSPKGEKRDFILSLGLNHTSMFLNDLAIDENAKIYICETYGWTII